MSEVAERTEREEEARLVELGRQRDRLAKANAEFFKQSFLGAVKDVPTKWDPAYDYDPLWDQLSPAEKAEADANFRRTLRRLANVFHRQRYQGLYAFRLNRHCEREKVRALRAHGDAKRAAASPGWTLKKWKDRTKRPSIVPSGFRRSMPTLIPLHLEDWKRADWRKLPDPHPSAQAEAARALSAVAEMRVTGGMNITPSLRFIIELWRKPVPSTSSLRARNLRRQFASRRAAAREDAFEAALVHVRTREAARKAYAKAKEWEEAWTKLPIPPKRLPAIITWSTSPEYKLIKAATVRKQKSRATRSVRTDTENRQRVPTKSKRKLVLVPGQPRKATWRRSR